MKRLQNPTNLSGKAPHARVRVSCAGSESESACRHLSYGDVGLSHLAHGQARLDGGDRQSNSQTVTDGCDAHLTP